MGDNQLPLWNNGSEETPKTPNKPFNAHISKAIWTEHKAQLIQRYLWYFVLVTRHGVYIDGFAGPHKPDFPDTWAANLVLENDPRRLRKFYFFDRNPRKIALLEGLRDHPPAVSSGVQDPLIEVRSGDFNTRIHEILTTDHISNTEATFCLLDQQTFECHWSTVQALAHHKVEAQNKIELFYFFPQGWIDRAMGGLLNTAILERWWGRTDWDVLRRSRGDQRVALLRDRFITELGYKYVVPFPILSRRRRGPIMYYMIHASDHKRAPELMLDAYREIVRPDIPPTQADFWPDTL